MGLRHVPSRNGKSCKISNSNLCPISFPIFSSPLPIRIKVTLHFCILVLQHCCLCSMRGGALKRTSDGWVHLMCALLLPGVNFKDAIHKDPINVFTVKAESMSKQCRYCEQRHGACLNCRQCANWFHVSCGYVAGANFNIPAYNSHELQVSFFVFFNFSHICFSFPSVLLIEKKLP